MLFILLLGTSLYMHGKGCQVCWPCYIMVLVCVLGEVSQGVNTAVSSAYVRKTYHVAASTPDESSPEVQGSTRGINYYCCSQHVQDDATHSPSGK